MLEIKNSLDWPKVETEIRRLKKTVPMFEADIKRVSNYINSLVTELSQLEVKARSTRSRSVTDDCSKKVAKINEELKQIQKFHLMAVLSR
jgi:archaellum component FlaC